MDGLLLLVDDSESMNYLHSHMAREFKSDLSIHCCTHGKEALNFILSKGNPENSNLVLLDINMPVMDGWEFLEEFEKLPAELKSKYTVVIVSTTQNPDDVKRAQQIESCKDLISKPISEEALAELIQEHSLA